VGVGRAAAAAVTGQLTERTDMNEKQRRNNAPFPGALLLEPVPPCFKNKHLYDRALRLGLHLAFLQLRIYVPMASELDFK
jgi:hypothetical protein